jgi:hypothetical protein
MLISHIGSCSVTGDLYHILSIVRLDVLFLPGNCMEACMEHLWKQGYIPMKCRSYVSLSVTNISDSRFRHRLRKRYCASEMNLTQASTSSGSAGVGFQGMAYSPCDALSETVCMFRSSVSTSVLYQ